MKQDDMVSAAYAQGRRNQRESDEALLRKALEALEMSRRFVYADNRPQCDDAIDALRAALAQQEDPVQEPVAWRFKAMIGLPWSLSDDGYYISCKRDQRYFVEALYTTPPQRKPLTQEEIDRICASLGFAAISPAEIVRAVERAHGIGETK